MVGFLAIPGYAQSFLLVCAQVSFLVVFWGYVAVVWDHSRVDHIHSNCPKFCNISGPNTYLIWEFKWVLLIVKRKMRKGKRKSKEHLLNKFTIYFWGNSTIYRIRVFDEKDAIWEAHDMANTKKV